MFKKESGIKPDTVKQNCNAVLRIARVITSLKNSEVPLDKNALLETSLSVFCVANMRQWRDAKMAGSSECDIKEKNSRRRSANADLRMAKSVFGEKASSSFVGGPTLPDMTGLRDLSMLPAESDMSYRELPDEILRAIDEHIAGYPDPRIRLAYGMVRHLGMRNIEVLAARWEWIEHDKMVIKERSYFTPKNGRKGERKIPIPPALLAEIESHRGNERPDDQRKERDRAREPDLPRPEPNRQSLPAGQDKKKSTRSANISAPSRQISRGWLDEARYTGHIDHGGAAEFIRPVVDPLRHSGRRSYRSAHHSQN